MTTQNTALAVMAAGWFHHIEPLNGFYQERAIHCEGHREQIVVHAHKLMCWARKKKKPELVKALGTLKKLAQELDHAEFGKELIDLPMLLAYGLDIRCKLESVHGCTID